MIDRYTHGHDESVLDNHRRRTAANSAGYLLPHLREGQSLLDVGCGPGTITADLAALVAPGEVVAIDNVASVLDEARREAAERRVENIRFSMQSAYGLEFEDAVFDVVHAHQLLQHLSEPLKALAEMKRVCKPGGIVAIRDVDYGAMTWYPADPLLEKWRNLYRTLARENDGEPDAGRRVLAWAHEVGFASVEPSVGVWCFATPETRAWWGGLWAERTSGTAIALQALQSGHATQAELEEMATAWRRWVDDPDGWFSVVHGEAICRP